jgi:hypothetical protein
VYETAVRATAETLTEETADPEIYDAFSRDLVKY